LDLAGEGHGVRHLVAIDRRFTTIPAGIHVVVGHRCPQAGGRQRQHRHGGGDQDGDDQDDGGDRSRLEVARGDHGADEPGGRGQHRRREQRRAMVEYGEQGGERGEQREATGQGQRQFRQRLLCGGGEARDGSERHGEPRDDHRRLG
jgi:hypothetical protein